MNWLSLWGADIYKNWHNQGYPGHQGCRQGNGDTFAAEYLREGKQ